MPTPRIPPAGLGSALAAGLGSALAAAVYPAALLAGTSILQAQAPARRQQCLAWLSTDLHNLATHPVGSLLGSALVCEGDLLAWLVLALAGLTGLGLRIGARAAAGLVLAVHVLATLVSQGVVALRIAGGQLPGSARVMSDVGPSYLVVAALIGALVYGPVLGRVLGGVGFALLAPSLFGGLTRLEVSAMGHLASIVLAVLLGGLVARRQGTPDVKTFSPGAAS
jgi:hypothetical protein